MSTTDRHLTSRDFYMFFCGLYVAAAVFVFTGWADMNASSRIGLSIAAILFASGDMWAAFLDYIGDLREFAKMPVREESEYIGVTAKDLGFEIVEKEIIRHKKRLELSTKKERTHKRLSILALAIAVFAIIEIFAEFFPSYQEGWYRAGDVFTLLAFSCIFCGVIIKIDFKAKRRNLIYVLGAITNLRTGQ